MSYSFSVIVSTFNSELWLHKVLIGFNNQTYKDFELIVADDGSNHKTRDLIEKIKHNVFYKLTHVWQPDHGFQKTIILNKALLKSKNVEIEEFDIWKDPAKAKEMLQRTNGARSIPQIFIGDHYIGGNEQLQNANRSGELDKLLA